MGGIRAKASSLGAKTVNGPLPLRVSTNSAFSRRLKKLSVRLDNFGVDFANSTIVGKPFPKEL